MKTEQTTKASPILKEKDIEIEEDGIIRKFRVEAMDALDGCSLMERYLYELNKNGSVILSNYTDELLKYAMPLNSEGKELERLDRDNICFYLNKATSIRDLLHQIINIQFDFF
jgi:hypothetical protein